jgi:GNAT superfamily N-acetyltransferase
MEGPRAPTETEWSRVVEFLNANLRPDSHWSIANEYPTALSTANLGNVRIIADGNTVISHAVLKPLILRTPTAILKVGAIGSVVTDSARRGQGLSSQILQECLNEAARQDCDIAVLWTNLYDFYRRLDFELAGAEESVVLQEELTLPPHALRMMKGNHVSAEALLRLYAQHSVGSVRTAEDIRKFLTIPNTTLYTAWEKDGTLAAFAVEGKGADLTGYLHEWGGSVSKLLALFGWIRKERKDPITVICGRQSTNLLGALKALPGALHNEGYLGMIKLIRVEPLFQKIHKAAKSIGIPNLVLEKKAGEFHLGVGNNIVQFPDEKDMVRVLFGPMPEIPYLNPETIQTIERILPLPLWLWGWDSI